MKSNLSGFVLSALIHSALFGFVAFAISNEPVKKPLPEPRVLSLAMFKEVVEPPAVPVETVQKKEEPKVIAKKMPAQEKPKPIFKKKKVTPKKRKSKKKVKAKKPPKLPVKKRSRDKELEQLLAATAKPVKRPAPRVQANRPVARAPHVTPRRQQQVVYRRPVVASKQAPVRPVRKPVSRPKQAHSSVKSEAAYKARLQQLIAAHKKYPRRAKRSGDEGVVKVSFVILPNGTISQIQLVQSSGSRTLDAAAKKVLTQVSGKLPFPQGINKSQWHLTLPIRYRLN